jgi:hypothetical protein
MVFLYLLLIACDPVALKTAALRGESFDLPGALEAARAAGDCDEAGGSIELLEGLLAAPAAVSTGGTTDSLRDLRSAANALSRRAEGGERRWEVASMMMRAVAAASQHERGEMAIYLAEATRIEGVLQAAKMPRVPLISAHELAGELWLQVHRFEDARTAYQKAEQAVGRTGRVRLGLARAAVRLVDRQSACREYRSFMEWWGGRSDTPPEVAEARTFLASSCGDKQP